MPDLSIIIPARGCPLLSRTVDDIFEKATGDIEVIVISDGEWPNPPLKYRKNLILIHTGQPRGLRSNINSGVNIAKGKYIYKSDDHCMFAKGFDEVLKAECDEDWIVIPSRYSLDGVKWERRRGPIDYLFLTYPYRVDELYGAGFHGRKWHGPHGLYGSYWHMEKERKHIKLDDILTFQGSGYFMPKSLFNRIGGLDTENSYFSQEAIELGFKVWLSGGKVVRNKKTWYAHLHKGKQWGRGFRMSKRKIICTNSYHTDYWMNNRWPKQIHKLEWLIDKFWPLDGWPEDWQNPKYAKEFIDPNQNLLEQKGEYGE